MRDLQSSKSYFFLVNDWLSVESEENDGMVEKEVYAASECSAPGRRAGRLGSAAAPIAPRKGSCRRLCRETAEPARCYCLTDDLHSQMLCWVLCARGQGIAGIQLCKKVCVGAVGILFEYQPARGDCASPSWVPSPVLLTLKVSLCAQVRRS